MWDVIFGNVKTKNTRKRENDEAEASQESCTIIWKLFSKQIF